MFLRIRGKGASPENSQAAVMHLRGFRHIAIEVPPLLNTFISTDSSVFCLDQRPFAFVHFATGIDAMTLMDRQCECFMSSAFNVATNHNLDDLLEKNKMQNETDTFDEERRLVWKETWNLYDIVYDDVELLPSSFTFTNNLLKQLFEFTERVCQVDHDVTNLSDKTDLDRTASTLQHIEPIPSSFSLPSTLLGNKKAVVCTHYYAHEAIVAKHLEVQQLEHVQENNDTLHSEQRASCLSTQPSLQELGQEQEQGRYSVQKDIIVLDLSIISDTSAGFHLAREMAWLAAFVTLQDYNYLFSARVIVVRLPYDHVPSIHELQQLEEILMTINTNSKSSNDNTDIKGYASKSEENSPAQTNSETEKHLEKEENENSGTNLQSHELIQLMSRDDQANMVNAIKMTLEALDFLAEHLTLLHSSFVQIFSQFAEVQTTQSNLDINNNSNNGKVSTSASANNSEWMHQEKRTPNATNLPDKHFTKFRMPSPQICFIDRSQERLENTLTSLCMQGNNDSKTSPEAVCNVVYVIGDHHEQQQVEQEKQNDSSTHTPASQHQLTQEELSESYLQYISHVLQTLPCTCTPVTLIAPLKALINDEEEAWDPYVQRERARLNYCPCCSKCSHHHETEQLEEMLLLDCQK